MKDYLGKSRNNKIRGAAVTRNIMAYYIDGEAQAQKQAQYAEPAESLKAACISEAIDNYIYNPTDENLSEVRYYQEELASRNNKLREMKNECKSMSDDGNGTATFIYNKLRNL